MCQPAVLYLISRLCQVVLNVTHPYLHMYDSAISMATVLGSRDTLVQVLRYRVDNLNVAHPYLHIYSAVSMATVLGSRDTLLLV